MPGSPPPSKGPQLALLLLGGFRTLVDAAVVELARRGYEDVRPVHEFALRAIASGAEDASALGRHLSVSKQAAAKTIALLEERGYVAREDDPLDARRKLLRVTKRGYALMRDGEAIFDELRERWAQRIGPTKLRTLEKQLAELVGSSSARLDDTPGWMARGLGE